MANIRFEKIKIHNFLSFGDAEYNLDDNGFVLVTGENHCEADSANSNGSGKSTLWCAISWALTGQTIRGTKDVCNNRLEDGAIVELEFTVNNDRYRIIRAKNNKQYKTNLLLYVNDKDVSGKGIRDTEKILTEYLPDITSTLLGSVIIMGQGLPCRFSANTPSGRKEVLENLFNSDFMIEDIKARIETRKTFVSEQLNELEQTINALMVDVGTKTQLKEDAEKTLAEMPGIDDLQNTLAGYQDELATATAEVNRVATEKDKADEKVTSLSADLLSISVKKNDRITTVAQKLQEELSSLSDKEAEIKSVAMVLSNEVKAIDEIKDICPTCGQPIKGVVKPNIDDKRKQLEQYRTDYKAVLAEKKTAQAKADDEKAKIEAEFAERLHSAEAELNGAKTVQSNLSAQYQQALRVQSQKSASVEAYKAKIAEHTATIDRLNNRIAELTAQTDEIKDNIKTNQEKAEQLKARQEILSMLSTVTSRDFRGVLLQNILASVNEKIAEYCTYVYDGNKIVLSADGNNITIKCGDTFYENLSGGERRKVDVIIQLSIRATLMAYMGFSTNICVFDEVFDGLDWQGCDKIVSLITSKLNEVTSVYIITHRKDIDIPFDSHITIVKNEEGISHIAYDTVL